MSLETRTLMRHRMARLATTGAPRVDFRPIVSWSILAMTALGLIGIGAARTAADTIVYSNVDNFSGFGITQDSSADDGSGNGITRLVADDITPIAGYAGRTLTEVAFSVVNLNAVAVSARPRIRFYDSDGAGGGPGTLITGFTIIPSTFPGNSHQVYGFDVTSLSIALPSTTFWAGITFDNDSGATGATLAQLDRMGQVIFDPPTIGSSADQIFETDSAGSFFSSDPAGSIANFGGNPIANLAWEFSVAGDAAIPSGVPEPSTFVLAAAGVLVLGLVAWRRRRCA